MKIIWNGHSCFTVSTQEGTVVLDPYSDGSVPGFGPLNLQADRVLCSHGHRDHNSAENVRLSGDPCGVEVHEIPSWHDDAQGTKRGPNTIHVLCAEGMKIAHLGDLGCMLNEEQIAALSGLDALLIPVGGYYTIDAEQAVEIVKQLRPRVTIPMHYRRGDHGYDVISTLDGFLQLCDNPVEYPDNVLVLDKETPSQTAILRLA
ncbi:MAG: MBL fold metallo-hydrolase [Oscillospiraceae bacterium]|nr:MBL fold metallo-hydrolase [Oscillospiraceae bacterium]